MNIRNGCCLKWYSFSLCVDCTFKSTKKLHRDILDLQDKFTITPGLDSVIGNLLFDLSVYFVPAPTVIGDYQNIAYYINQSTIFMLNKVEQE